MAGHGEQGDGHDGSVSSGEWISGYHVYDRRYEKIGKVDDLFVDEDGRPEYVGVKMGGLLGSKSALIPMDVVRINEKRELVEVEVEKDTIKGGPSFGDPEDITPELEQRVCSYYGVERERVSEERSLYALYHPGLSTPPHDERIDVEPGERTFRRSSVRGSSAAGREGEARQKGSRA